MMLQPDTAVMDVRSIESSQATEFHLTLSPADESAPSAEEAYSAIARFLRENDAAIVGERLFATPDLMPATLAARRRALGDLDDAVPPTQLLSRDMSRGVLGIQVYAISGIGRPLVLRTADSAAGRAFDCGAIKYLAASNLLASSIPQPGDQARTAFTQGMDLVQMAGGTVHDIARTWIWMDDILSWYGDLNRVRNTLFKERGLFDRPDSMPASTGIGVSPARGRVALDLFAAWGAEDAVTRYHAAGRQCSAYEYGSAFARASCVKTPGGRTIFCSGTAAIDPAGRTCFLNDVAGQVQMTLDNVNAVLSDLGCTGRNVVQAMAYCATPEVEEWFNARHRPNLSWPVLVMQGDVCRDDLLFEVEVTAARSC